MMIAAPRTLPPPDTFGNFWFGERPAQKGQPAILKRADGKGFMLSLGVAGMHWTGSVLTTFRRPTQALRALNARLRSDARRPSLVVSGCNGRAAWDANP